MDHGVIVAWHPRWHVLNKVIPTNSNQFVREYRSNLPPTNHLFAPTHPLPPNTEAHISQVPLHYAQISVKICGLCDASLGLLLPAYRDSMLWLRRAICALRMLHKLQSWVK